MDGRPTAGCRFRSLIGLFCVLVLAAGSCSDDDVATSTAAQTTTTTSTAVTTTTTTSATTTTAVSTTAPTTTTTPEAVLEPLEGTLTVGVAEEIVEGNIWELYDEGGSSTSAAVVWYDAPLISSYWSRPCGYLAATDSPEPVRDGDHWTVTIPLREGFLWSDGEEVTAQDYLFTMEVIEEFDLGNFWLWWHPVMTPDDPDTPEDEEIRWIEQVRALDDHTVELVFSPSQDLPSPVGYQDILRGIVQPEHFWRPIVDACRAEDDPKACLHEADAAGRPSAGDFTIESWGQGEVILAANPDSFLRGTIETEYANGALIYTGGRLEEDITCGDPEGSHIVKQATNGPFVERVRMIGYGTAEEALEAFIRGDIDFTPQIWLDSVSEDYRRRILELPDVTVVVNPTDAWEALWFNLRKPPMSDLAFRQALAYVIDREAILGDVPASGSAIYSIISPYNPTWYTDDVDHWGRGMSDPERLDAAVQVLTDAGYTWTTRPEAVRDDDGEYTGEIIDGEGLIQPDGTPVPELDYLVPPDRELRRVAGESIPEFADRLGITITWQPTDLGTIQRLVGWAGPPPEDGLGWDLFTLQLRAFGGQVWPCGGLQGLFEPATDSEFEALSDALDVAAADPDPTARFDEARPICAAMEADIADNLPVIVLWSPLITEFWRNTIELPETERLWGLGNIALSYAKIRE